MKLEEHPTVRSFRQKTATARAMEGPRELESSWLRQVCLNAGADDVGFVEIDRPELADQRKEILAAAGEDVIGPFLTDRPGFLQQVVKPLLDKEEIVYVVPGSDAEAHVARRFSHKKPSG